MGGWAEEVAMGTFLSEKQEEEIFQAHRKK